MKVKITGIQAEHLPSALDPGGSGFIFIWQELREAHDQRPDAEREEMADQRHLRRIIGKRPNRLKILVGSGAERSLIQPKNGACRISMVIEKTL